jgi:FAD/FMN-containing dehydrogenase
VLVDDGLRAPYETDWIRRWSGRADAVVRPGTAEEVAAVVAWCGANSVAVVPQGGNTGWSVRACRAMARARPARRSTRARRSCWRSRG